MNRIGSPAVRNETPACSPDRYPDDQSRAEIACTCSVFVGLATSTTKVGRLSFSEPNPYDVKLDEEPPALPGEHRGKDFERPSLGVREPHARKTDPRA